MSYGLELSHQAKKTLKLLDKTYSLIALSGGSLNYPYLPLILATANLWKWVKGNGRPE